MIHYLESFLSSAQLPSLMHNIGLAFITLFIPAAIFIMQDKDKLLFEWDVKVILCRVIKIQNYIPIALLFVFIPAFFWDASHLTERAIIFVIFICGIFFFLGNFYSIWKWINQTKKYRWGARTKYLNSIKSDDQENEVWSSIWKMKLNSLDEEKLLKIFVEKINGYFERKEFTKARNLLETFNAPLLLNMNIKNRNAYLLRTIFLSPLLNWYQISIENKGDKKSPDDLERFLNDLFQNCITYIIINRIPDDPAIIFDLCEEIIKKHIEKNPKHIKKILTSFSSAFIRAFYSDDEQSEVWENVPAEWKLTVENVKNESNAARKIWFKAFAEWAKNIICQPQKNSYKKLQIITRGLFPKVDLLYWGEILQLVFIGEDSIENILKHPYVFGSSNRNVKTYTEKLKDGSTRIPLYDQDEINETCTLAQRLFPKTFANDNLKKYIQELKKLKSEDEDQKIRIERVLFIFEHIKKHPVR